MTTEPNQASESEPVVPEAPRPNSLTFEDLFGPPPAVELIEAPKEEPSQVQAEGLVLESFAEETVAVEASDAVEAAVATPEAEEAKPVTEAEPIAEVSAEVAPLNDLGLVTEAPAVADVVASAEPVGLRLNVTAHSDIGCVRTNNEDSFGYDPAHGLYIVCDGMGGMASGEIASSMAVSTALSHYAASAGSGLAVSTRLLEAIRAANAAVWEFGQQAEHRGMGTTLVAAAQDGDTLIVGNVGDSRAYMVKPGKCIQITVDHSYINELIRNGTLTLENAKSADLKGMESVITRAIGAGPLVEPDFFAVQPHSDDMVLLASDGLTRYLNAEELLELLSAAEFTSGPEVLIAVAKQRGGVDNITCLVVKAA